MNLINHQFRLATRPVGIPKRSDWNYVEEPVRDPGPGEVLVKTLYMSVDPAMRMWMNPGIAYISVGIGEVMLAGGAGMVIASNNPAFAEGDYVTGVLGAQEYALISDKDPLGLTKVDPELVPLPVYLGALGLTGMTAYFGLLDVGQAKAGETVVVSGAAGAVGMVVGQIARIKGCRAVGIAGGQEKCEFILDELGFNEAIDYKRGNVAGRLRQYCPHGVNVYFDNVGGDILEAVLAHLAYRARVVLCGAISQYNSTTGTKAPSNYMSLVTHTARMEGMGVFNYTSRYDEAVQEMAGWMKAGKLQSHEHIVEGLHTFPDTLLKLFRGESVGKLLIKVADA
jgi:NADPH-dependent curcumin reductase CurA